MSIRPASSTTTLLCLIINNYVNSKRKENIIISMICMVDDRWSIINEVYFSIIKAIYVKINFLILHYWGNDISQKDEIFQY